MKLCRRKLHDLDDPAVVYVMPSGQRTCRICVREQKRIPMRAVNAKRRANNLEGERIRVATYMRKAYASNPHAVKAKRYQSDSTSEIIDYFAVIEHDPCSYCGGPATENDHIVAVNKNGRHEWDNFTRACRHCNASKSDKSLLLWMLDKPGLPAVN